jgi:hypothetical protein
MPRNSNATSCDGTAVLCFQIIPMDILHAQLTALQHKLAWVSVDPVDWKLYAQVLSWSISLFESYLM